MYNKKHLACTGMMTTANELVNMIQFNDAANMQIKLLLFFHLFVAVFNKYCDAW